MHCLELNASYLIKVYCTCFTEYATIIVSQTYINVLFYFSEDFFQELQNEFMEKHYHHFEDVEENKLIYTDIFTQYVSVI